MKTVIKTNATDEAKSAVNDAQRTARSTARDAGSRARSAAADARSAAAGARRTARKTARRTYLRGRIAAARATASRRASRNSTTSKKVIAAAGAAGAAGAYFLDPQEGNRRRKLAIDRVTALFRKGGENDQALAERVKSEIFQPADAPKDKVSVNVERGVVYLRGEVPKEGDISKLVKQANAVDGVNGVESLLHSS
jgi:osmotically-inducible protein OsmY